MTWQSEVNRLFSSTIKIKVLFNSISKILFAKFANFCTISIRKNVLKSFFEYKKKFTQYTHQLLLIILFSTLVNFYLLVILYEELLLKKAAIYGVKKR
jgi:hypothetical protein